MLTFLVACLTLLSACASNPTQHPPEKGKGPWELSSTLLDQISEERSLANPGATVKPSHPRQEYFTANPHPATLKENNTSPNAVLEEPHFELNFHDADVRTVIDAILGDMLHLDYVVSPEVSGEITFRTSEPIPASSLLSALESALTSVSAVVVDTGQSINIIPTSEASSRVNPTYQPNRANAQRPPGYAIEVVPLHYANADEMKVLLESILPRGTILRADQSQGLLVIAGTSQERSAVLRTISSFDVNWLEGMNFAIYHLTERRPAGVTTELKEIFQGKYKLFPNRVRLVTLDQIQAILGIARTKQDLELVGDWIQRLDVVKPADKKMYVYNVQNSSAETLVTALSRLIGRDPADSSAPEPSMESTNMDTYQLQNNSSSLPAKGQLVAIEETNSLLFYGTSQEYRAIEEALQQIDILPRQVMIEAILAEVTLNNQLRYGVQWFFESGNISGTLSNTDTGSTSPRFPGFSLLYSGGADARAVLDALQSETKVTILSAPKLSVLNNQKAMLQVGDQVPVVTQTSQSTIAPDAPVVSTVEMRDTGVILEVTPRVNENGNIILDVMQEVSEVAKTTSSGIDSPTIQQRKLHTTVATRDGFTVALGGLIRGTSNDGNTGVPILKDIPYLGNLFKDNTQDSRRTELIVLLVPHVMRNQTETQAVVEALIEGLNSAADVARKSVTLQPK